ncbi:putative integral membrane protein (TIGR02327 family) [Alkalibacillus flavidus]|uniref:Integral membrane protein (TIGR02327 family) n=1 Tax=Alkalibacillus flavidus TaxID=546021 RepID=A0ABV2KXF0_9BACI
MLMQQGVDALIGITSHIIFIILAWKGLDAINIQALFKKNKEIESKLLWILLSIALGVTVSNFFLDFVNWSQKLSYLL